MFAFCPIQALNPNDGHFKLSAFMFLLKHQFSKEEKTQAMNQATHAPHVTSYKCVSAAQPDQLQSLVETEIHNGWQPYGSLAATGRDENIVFVQPMVQVAELYR